MVEASGDAVLNLPNYPMGKTNPTMVDRTQGLHSTNTITLMQETFTKKNTLSITVYYTNTHRLHSLFALKLTQELITCTQDFHFSGMYSRLPACY